MNGIIVGFGKVSISRAGARQGEASTILLSHQHPTPTFDIHVQTTIDFLSFWILRTCGTANDVVQHCCRTAYLTYLLAKAMQGVRLKFQFILVAHETPSSSVKSSEARMNLLSVIKDGWAPTRTVYFILLLSFSSSFSIQGIIVHAFPMWLAPAPRIEG